MKWGDHRGGKPSILDGHGPPRSAPALKAKVSWTPSKLGQMSSNSPPFKHPLSGKYCLTASVCMKYGCMKYGCMKYGWTSIPSDHFKTVDYFVQDCAQK